uniref:Putative DNA binding, helix-turn-helix domain containing protein n=1 Tax=viral metagenome TaxID=1070528 RepID=A0A6M3LCE0_9ZZZZ
MANIILEYRIQKGISQAALAERVGISRQLLHWHEQDPERKWSYANAVKIDQATQGKVRWIELVK